jgi:hypothetical protein
MHSANINEALITYPSLSMVLGKSATQTFNEGVWILVSTEYILRLQIFWELKFP